MENKNIEKNEIENEEIKNNGTDNNKSNKTIIIILIILIIILAFGIGYLLGTSKDDNNAGGESLTKEKDNNFEEDEDHENEKDSEDTIDTEDKEEKTDSNNGSEEYAAYEFDDWKEKMLSEIKDQAKELNINNKPDYINNSYGLPIGLCSMGLDLDEKDIYLKDLNSIEKMAMLVSYTKSPYTDSNIKSDYDVLGLTSFKEDFAKLFFEDTSFLKKIGDKEYQLLYPYSIVYRNNKYYVITWNGGCTITGAIGLNASYMNSRKEGKYVIKTYYAYYFGIETRDNKDYARYYKDKEQKELIYEHGMQIDNPRSIDEFKDKLNTYDLYFDTSNNNFRFEKMIFHRK